jgi:hypothetical protein
MTSRPTDQELAEARRERYLAVIEQLAEMPERERDAALDDI